MDALAPEVWQRLLHRSPADAALCPVYGPLLAPPHARDGCFVLGRIAQSLDGRIATSRGQSHWISGPDDIRHTHRLRALFDAVVVGAGTVRADDPQLTTREVTGPSPVRVVLDTERRLDADRRIFHGAPETLLLCANDAPGQERVGCASVLRLPRARAGLDIAAVLDALAARGLRRVLVEGGGVTVSRFLAAGALDRLHVTIAPMLIGSGIPAFSLPEPADLSHSLRFGWTVHRIGDDLLLDIPLARAGTPM
jgi:riboflavin-specific deaminase-like protein